MTTSSLEIHREGKGYRLVSELFLAHPIEVVFPFFSEARNLEALTPSLLRFEILSPGPLDMKNGLLIDYRLRVRGIPFRWRSRISAWDPPRRFVDEQVRGPYWYWIHEHTFEPQNGGTMVRDTVRYAPIGGRLIHELFVRKDLEAIFRFRGEELLRRFPTTEKP